jgi:hypothetical protein
VNDFGKQPDVNSCATKKLDSGHLKNTGVPDRNRTCNPQLRRLVLYPVELRAQFYSWAILYIPNLVGVERFELPTSCSQSRRATRLRYTPKAAHYTGASL